MATWFIIQDGKRLGPYDDAGLREMAATGRLRPSDGILKDGMAQPVEAAKVRGLFPAAATPSPQAAEASDKGPSQDEAATTPKLGRLKGAAEAVARAAAMKKLQLHDLPHADFAIGARAYELTLASDELTSVFQDVRRLEQELQTKREPASVPAHETIGDRTKRIAAEAKKRLDAELLAKQRKQRLAEAGRIIREGSNQTIKSQLADEIAAAQQVANKLAALEAEDLALGRPSPWRRLALAGAAVPVMVVSLWGVKDLVTTSPEEQHQATLEQIRAETESRRLADEAARAEEDRRYKEEQARQASQLELEEAELAANRERRKREEEAARKARELAREKERLREEQEEAAAAAEKLANQRAEEARQAAETEREQLRLKEEHDTAQVARAELAESLFSKIALDPDRIFELSASARKARAKLELRSSELSTLQQFLAVKNWLGLIGHLNDTAYDEYPDARDIERAFGRLQDSQFHLLVRLDRRYLQNDRGPQLCSITFPGRREHEDYEYPDVANVTQSWELHPDGIGVTRVWRLTDGPAVIALSNRDRIDAGIRNTKEQLGEQYLALAKKAQLGEIDAALVVPEMQQAINAAQAKLKAAALKL